MSEELTLEQFEKHLGEPFLVRVEDQDIELTLVEATNLAKSDPNRSDKFREPFSLLFQGPLEPELLQQIVPLKHDQLGDLSLFMVPVGRNPDGVRYEVIFN